MNFPLFIARRIYSDHIGDQQKVSKPAIRIAVAGVAIGLAVMIISVCVVLGFKHTIRDKVVGFGSHIQVANFYTLQSSAIDQPVAIGDSMMNVLKRTDGVKHVQRFAMKQGILKTDNDFLGVMFKGVGPEFDSTFIHKSMVEGSIPHFSDQQSTNRILISKDMASKLRVKAGDRIFAYFIGEGGVRTRRFTISGVYQTNLAQYDKTTCFCDLYTARKLNAWTDDMVTGAELTVNDFKQLGTTANDIINRVNRTQDQYGNTFSSKTIRELSPQIFSWLDLLDLNVWIILAIMTAVAVVTMISGLLIIILERTTMIGVLKALGARNSTVRHTFLWFAAFIIGKGLLIGDALALVLILLQKLTGFAKLDPQTYYVDVVPVELDWTLIVALNIATMLIALFVLIAPSYLVSHIHPAKSMRYE
ncbi:ABC transporter permease [Prevotella sp.]|uniref:ABC transporter permease n=1 Tax=Prevotella sp. TaxID=59823 RepID=UPI0025FE71AE|nr:FtsX-like permease family protein [Prevotella sp.]MCI7371578.1 ABC transporter permease [Prevotella sp.]MDD6198929.1 ABC transporter permease [Prevotella sp.]MDY3967421.1 FtsX-like permease family protein [Prevotella sp.]